MSKVLTDRIRKHLNEEYPNLKSRVILLEKKQEEFDTVQRRVDKVEVHVEAIAEEVKGIKKVTTALTNEFLIFKDNVRKELNRFLCWLTGIFLVVVSASLIGGLAAGYQYVGKMFESIILEVKRTNELTNDKCSNLKEDIYKLKVDMDTTKSKLKGIR